MHKLNIVLSGQRAFGCAVYEMLREHPYCRLGAVFAPAGDKLYDLAMRGRVETLQAGTLRAANIPPHTDLLIAAHSHDFIGAATRNRLRIGAVGYHPSLLPRHRGRDAVKWTIRMRDLVAGGTVYWLTDNIDSGPIAAQEWCWVDPAEDAHALWRRALFPMGVRLLAQVVGDVAAGRVVQRDQDAAAATWEPALDSTPLYRPELVQIGTFPDGFNVIK